MSRLTFGYYFLPQKIKIQKKRAFHNPGAHDLPDSLEPGSFDSSHFGHHSSNNTDLPGETAPTLYSLLSRLSRVPLSDKILLLFSTKFCSSLRNAGNSQFPPAFSIITLAIYGAFLNVCVMGLGRSCSRALRSLRRKTAYLN